jgi:hypothetical protein
MSKYMQIDIRLMPFYEKGFKGHFPKLSRAMERSGYLDSGGPEASLYSLVDVLGRMNLDPQVLPPVKERLRPFLEKLIPLKEMAREALLARRLNELDQVLYRIEDEFEDLERAF